MFWVVAIGLLVVALTLVVLLQFIDPELPRPFFQFVARTDAV